MSILLTIQLILSPAHAGNTADEAELNFQLARESYTQGDFEQALFHFMVSNRLAPNRNVTFNIGRTYHALGRYPEAYRWYQDALNASEPTSKRVIDEIQASLDRLRPKVSLLRVETEPSGATVYLRRKNLGAVGTTPLEVPLRPDTYNVIVELQGHEDVETGDFNLKRAGMVQEVSLELTPIVGTVAIAGEAGATVHVGSEDSTSVCEIPCEVDLPEGEQILFFKKPGFRSLPSLLTVVREERQEVSAELLPITGTLIVDADERGALIEVDGKPAGYTPAVLSNIQVGDHMVRVTSRGFEPTEIPVTVAEDETVDVGRVMLSPRFVVTAASRFAEEVSEAPASVTIIPREEIRAFGYQSIAEAVVGTRGFYQTNDLTYRYLGVRGFGRLGDYNNRILLTVDGHRWNENVFGSSYVGEGSFSDLDDIQQIEVVRGPGSALYGSSAFLGVLNLVTRGKESEYSPHVVVTGAEGGIRARVGAGVGNEKAGAWASISGTYLPGRDYFFEEYADRPSEGFSTNSDESTARTVQAKAWVGDFEVQAVYASREKEMPTGQFGINLGDHRAEVRDRRAYVEARYIKSLKNTDVDARVSLDQYANRWFGPYGSSYWILDRHDELVLTGFAQVKQRFAKWLAITLGASTRQNLDADIETIEQVSLDDPNPGTINFNDSRLRTYSGYGVVDFRPSSILRFNLGGRFDQYSFVSGETFGAFTPRGAIIFRPGKESFKLMGGQAFRAPSAFEQFSHDNGASVSPAGELNQETIITGDFEWTHSFSEVLTSTFNAYYSQIDNLIEDQVVNDRNVIQKFNTPTTVRSAGAEAELRRFWRSGWMAAAQVSWKRTRSGDLLEGDELTNSPVWMASLLGAAPLGPNTTLATKIRGETPRLTNMGLRTNGALIWDATLTGDLERPRVGYGVGVRNILDWQIEYPGGSELIIDRLPGQGRTFFATLRVGI